MQSRQKAWYAFMPRKKAGGWLGASVRRLCGPAASIPAAGSGGQPAPKLSGVQCPSHDRRAAPTGLRLGVPATRWIVEGQSGDGRAATADVCRPSRACLSAGLSLLGLRSLLGATHCDRRHLRVRRRSWLPSPPRLRSRSRLSSLALAQAAASLMGSRVLATGCYVPSGRSGECLAASNRAAWSSSARA